VTTIHFAKYSGTGNDFILVDDRNQQFPLQNSALISKLCNRHQGIGADGLILLHPSTKADHRMRIFNADGFEAEMCGNGIRCLTKFIVRNHASTPNEFSIETMHRLIGVKLADNDVCVQMGPPTNLRWNLSTPLPEKSFTLHALDTGVPHTVAFVDTLQNLDVITLGHQIRHHPLFQPKGVNANFCRIDHKGELWIRTYERGVEGETQACGTGATACALAAAQIYSLPSPLKVHVLSGEVLTISFTANDASFDNVCMSGPAQQTFEGSFSL
jgi:diaminopimelate epimerase